MDLVLALIGATVALVVVGVEILHQNRTKKKEANNERVENYVGILNKLDPVLYENIALMKSNLSVINGAKSMLSDRIMPRSIPKKSLYYELDQRDGLNSRLISTWFNYLMREKALLNAMDEAEKFIMELGHEVHKIRLNGKEPDEFTMEHNRELMLEILEALESMIEKFINHSIEVFAEIKIFKQMTVWQINTNQGLEAIISFKPNEEHLKKEIEYWKDYFEKNIHPKYSVLKGNRE